MSDPRAPDDDTGQDGAPATPAWVKALAIAAAVVVLALVLVMVLIGGDHGPGRHL